MWDPRHLTTPRPVTEIVLLFCVAFIVCNVPFIVCVASCAVFCLGVVCCVVYYCSTTVTDKNSFAVLLNDDGDDDDDNNNYIS
jgi:hypothetical protein